MFKKIYSNHAIVGANEAGVVKHPVKQCSAVTAHKTALRSFLKEYQSCYRNGNSLPTIPKELKPFTDKLRPLFRLETDNIENIIKAAYRIKVPRPKNNKPKFNERNNRRKNRRK